VTGGGFSAKSVYLARAYREIPALLAEQAAAVGREIEARLADRDVQPIHPHILTSALRDLTVRGEIVLSPATRTRGKRELAVYHLPIVPGANKGRVEDAAARKRLLQTRFLSWTRASSKYPRGLVGPAGTRALYSALTDPSLAGRFSLIHPDGREVTHLFGDPVPGGPLDSGALAMGSRGGVAARAVYILFEVKNIRHWIYPSSWEIYQLLHKAAAVQLAHPTEAIAPVLICRRRHYWTRQMGIDLGFFVVEIHMQYLLPSTHVTADELAEVQRELGYSTLVRLDAPPSRLIQSLGEGLTPYLLSTADRWRSHGCNLVDHYRRLRDPDLAGSRRSKAVAELGSEAATLPGMAMDWRAQEEAAWVDDNA